MVGGPTELPYDMYCRYGVCLPGEPHMDWCSEYALGEIIGAKTALPPHPEHCTAQAQPLEPASNPQPAAPSSAQGAEAACTGATAEPGS